MSTYTVTITPDAQDGAEATVRLEFERGVARVTEIAVRPARGFTLGEGLTSSVDFDLLLRAVRPAVAALDTMQAAEIGEAAQPRAALRGPAPRSRAAAGRPTRRGRGARAAAPTPQKKAAAASGGRAYRRMPDDIAQTFAQIGSVTALAAHYGVPRHTAQGWVNRLRRGTAA